MKVNCSCGAVYQVTPAMAGKKVKCKKCSSTFQIPNKPSVRPTGSQLPPRKSVAQRRAEAEAAGRAPAGQRKSRTTGHARAKTPAELKKEREDAVLNKFIDPGRKTLEEQIVERRQDRIEQLRVTNSARYIVVGIVLIALGAGAFFLFQYMDDSGLRIGGGVGRRWGILSIVTLLYYTKAQWWLPAILFLAAAYHFLIGISSLMRIVDIDDEEGIPEHFGG